MKAGKNQERGLESVSHFFFSAPEPSVVKERVTIQAAARTLGVSKGTIITYLDKGLLTRIKVDGRIYVEMDEVRSFGGFEKKVSGLPAAALGAKGEELERLKSELDNLRQNLQAQTSELAETKIRIKQLEKNQQEGLVYLNRAKDSDDNNSAGEIRARLLAVEEELKRLDRSWWKRLLEGV